MTREAEERKSAFREYLRDCANYSEQKGSSLDTYWFDLKNERWETDGKSPFEYCDDVEFEPIRKKIDEQDGGNSSAQGANRYSRYLAELKFKKLLEWFVLTVRQNNDAGTLQRVNGQRMAEKIGDQYGRIFDYVKFSLNCRLAKGRDVDKIRLNFVFYPSSYINVRPIKKTKGTLVDFDELEIVVTDYAKNDKSILKASVLDLGLELSDFPNGTRFPNQKLREFFGKYAQLIVEFKKDGRAFQNKYGVTFDSDPELESAATVDESEGGDREEKPLNLIVYGPPGTGKTYGTIPRALAVIHDQPLAVWQEKYERDKQAVLDEFAAETEKADAKIAFVTFHQSYGYEEFIEGIKPKVSGGSVVYGVEDGAFKKFCLRAAGLSEGDEFSRRGEYDYSQNYVFIIDEINRGNVSKIFGELITLIEESKRIGNEEATLCTLPYGGKKFGVPKNVYVIGTMNTADRSLVQLDAALRRRFDFEELMPDPELLRGASVDGVDIEKLLFAVNEKITVLLDREHQIGHSYFMPLKNDPSIEKLNGIFKRKIIPLLQEYFFDDYEAIASILGSAFLQTKEAQGGKTYCFTKPKEWTAAAYRKIYGESADAPDEENE